MVSPCTLLKPKARLLHALPQLRLDAPRAEWLAYFENGWALTELLFSGLADEAAFYCRPYHRLRHPMIFYYAHPVALYVNKLRLAGLLDGPVRAEFEALFETGVDEMRWDDLHEDKDIWPSLSDVRTYRRQVHGLIRELIETHPDLVPGAPAVTQGDPLWALAMGFEHERIHLETSSVLMRELPIECVRAPEGWPELHVSSRVAENTFIEMAACEVALGKPRDVPTFGWDNEYGGEVRCVQPFAASRFLISNAEFHEFVTAGGYRELRFWSADGWAWRNFRNAKWPSFWVPDGPAGLNHYRLRTIFEIMDMQWSWPVCVNFHEAKAFCAWKSEQDGEHYRLLTEAEHYALRDGAPSGNLTLVCGAETPVDAYAANAKGFHDVFGNVWQWCEDDFHPLPGFAPHAYYDDFSTPCFDGEHKMIMGGSFISTGDEASAFARFHFRPHFFQHAGFRLVRAEHNDAKLLRARAYETREMLNRYLLMHWGSEAEVFDSALPHPQVQHLPVRCAELAAKFAESKERALDLGCAVGRASFELARDFREVLGIDYSREFIGAADALQRDGALEYSRKETGDAETRLTAQVDVSIDRTRARFVQGDACAVSPHLRDFDAVVLANVLCRLSDPAAALARMQGESGLVARGGVLVMTTPFSWLSEYTPRERWMDETAIRRALPEFTLVHEEEIPFVIREHRRKFEYIITHATVWKRS